MFARLLNSPAFVINLDRFRERYDKTEANLKWAGFSDVRRFAGTDALDAEALQAAYVRHGGPAGPVKVSDAVPLGSRGCLVSHFDVLQHIIDLRLPQATVFEDDAVMHSRWHALAPQYMAETPSDWEVLYLGNQPDCATTSRVATQSVWCRHAYSVTLRGAVKMLNAMKQWPAASPTGQKLGALHKGDIMLKDLQSMALQGRGSPFKWYNWNGTLEPDAPWNTPFDPKTKKITGDGALYKQRNYGLVFQDLHSSCADTAAFLAGR